jgi:hypothetical protein
MAGESVSYPIERGDLRPAHLLPYPLTISAEPPTHAALPHIKQDSGYCSLWLGCENFFWQVLLALSRCPSYKHLGGAIFRRGGPPVSIQNKLTFVCYSDPPTSKT